MASVNIGETLKEARLQKNISIDELQQMTKIQKRYLEIIEQNDFESLPGTFYVRAFIRQYASAVGLDGNQLVDIYDGKEPAIVEEPKPVYEELEGSRKQLHDEEKQSSWLLRNLPAIAFSLIGLAIAVVVLYIMWQDQKPNRLFKHRQLVPVWKNLKNQVKPQKVAHKVVHRRLLQANQRRKQLWLWWAMPTIK